MIKEQLEEILDIAEWMELHNTNQSGDFLRKVAKDYEELYNKANSMRVFIDSSCNHAPESANCETCKFLATVE